MTHEMYGEETCATNPHVKEHSFEPTSEWFHKIQDDRNDLEQRTSKCVICGQDLIEIRQKLP